MSDLTIGEVGVVLQVTLMAVDNSVSPPAQNPMNLTGATVNLLFVIASSSSEPPKSPTSKVMTIVDAVNGIVSYAFASGDLIKPPEMGKNGVFRYTIQINIGGNIFYTATDAQLSIKDESSL